MQTKVPNFTIQEESKGKQAPGTSKEWRSYIKCMKAPILVFTNFNKPLNKGLGTVRFQM